MWKNMAERKLTKESIMSNSLASKTQIIDQ